MGGLEESGRRALDIAVSSVVLVASAAFWPLIGGAICLESRGGVFYRAARVGQGGRPIQVFKFRTMVEGPSGVVPGVTVNGDARVTRVGRLLRRSKLDELPQFVNVLKGDMALVGPRPEDPRYVALYDDEQRKLLDVRPGLTSEASMAFRHEEHLLGTVSDPELHYRQFVLPAKLEIELAYATRRSIRSDVGILVRTLRALLMRPPS